VEQAAGGVFIDGEVGGEGPLLDVVNPSTEEVLGAVRTASAADIARAIASARRTYDAGDWAHMPRQSRVAAVMRLLDELDARKEAIRRIIVAEAGCPVQSPLMPVQLDGVLVHAREFAGYCLTVPECEPNPVPFNQRISPSGMRLNSRVTSTGFV